MNEVQRQLYLDQCGITLWYSHTPLAGAAPSVEFEFPLEEGEDEDGSRVEVVSPKRSISVNAPPKRTVVLTDHLPALHREIAKTVPVDLSADPVPDELSSSLQEAELNASTELSVELRIASSTNLVVIAQTGPGVSSDIQEKLLMQICQALGQPVLADSLQVLAWPVFKNRNVLGNNDAGLAAVLQHVLGGSRSLTWLGLGPDSRDLITAADRNSSSSGARFSCHYGLDELALSGAFKQELWREIRHLVIAKDSR